MLDEEKRVTICREGVCILLKSSLEVALVCEAGPASIDHPVMEAARRLPVEIELGKRKSEGQYFMKDLIAIVSVEPCYMCSMALIHSRISKLLFNNWNKSDGGIESKGIQINAMRNLNHSFQAFKID